MDKFYAQLFEETNEEPEYFKTMKRFTQVSLPQIRQMDILLNWDIWEGRSE